MVPGDTIPLTSVLRDRIATQAELSGEDVALWKKVKVGGAQQKVWPPLPPPLPGSGSQADPPAPAYASLCTQPQQTWIWCSHSQILGTRSSLGGQGCWA